MLVDYHCHTSFSQDCDYSMVEQVRAAIAKGVKEIAFTEHEDYNADDPTSFYFDHTAYWRDIAHYRQQFADEIVIRGAVEISEPHRYVENVQRLLSSFEWDVVLGSLHWLDGQYNTFLPSFFTAFGNWRESFRRYFVEMQTLAARGDFDILSHIDYPARYGYAAFGEQYDIAEWEVEIKAVLKEIIARGKGIEINTNPLRRKRSEPNPPAIVVKWFRELGGVHLTVGSDSHSPHHVGAYIPEAISIARRAGFTHITTYNKRNPIFINIETV
jgi:histidinol-phosphatase (PHP family)